MPSECAEREVHRHMHDGQRGWAIFSNILMGS